MIGNPASRLLYGGQIGPRHKARVGEAKNFPAADRGGHFSLSRGYSGGERPQHLVTPRPWATGRISATRRARNRR